MVIAGRRNDRLLSLALELTSKYEVEVVPACFDVRNYDEVKAAIQELPLNVKDNLEVLINNAGLAVGKGTIDKGELDDWNRMIDTNVKGLLHVSKVVIPFLKFG